MGLNLYSMAFSTLSPLQETVTVIRKTQIVTKQGLAVEVPESIFTIRASVVAKPPDELQRVPEYQNVNRAIEVSTNTPLIAGTPGHDADIVVWHGDQFVVSSLDDYSKNGRGFVTALCISIDATNQPPMGQ